MTGHTLLLMLVFDLFFFTCWFKLFVEYKTRFIETLFIRLIVQQPPICSRVVASSLSLWICPSSVTLLPHEYQTIYCRRVGSALSVTSKGSSTAESYWFCQWHYSFCRLSSAWGHDVNHLFLHVPNTSTASVDRKNKILVASKLQVAVFHNLHLKLP